MSTQSSRSQKDQSAQRRARQPVPQTRRRPADWGRGLCWEPCKAGPSHELHLSCPSHEEWFGSGYIKVKNMFNAVTEMATTSLRSCYGSKTDKIWVECMLPSLLGILPSRTVLTGSQNEFLYPRSG